MHHHSRRVLLFRIFKVGWRRDLRDRERLEFCWQFGFIADYGLGLNKLDGGVDIYVVVRVTGVDTHHLFLRVQGSAPLSVDLPFETIGDGDILLILRAVALLSYLPLHL